MTGTNASTKILWYVVPLLGNDREISNYTTAVTRQRPVNSYRRIVFSVRSVPRCYKHDKLAASESVGERVKRTAAVQLLLETSM
jgi:hypothetical protein